jgi:hypothetical protein
MSDVSNDTVVKSIQDGQQASLDIETIKDQLINLKIIAWAAIIIGSLGVIMPLLKKK